VTDRDEPSDADAEPPRMIIPSDTTVRAWLAAGASAVTPVACATLLGVIAGARLSLPDDAMLFLFAIMIAAFGGRRAGLLAASLSVAAYDFFFVPPRFTFAVADLGYVMTFAVMFTVGAGMGTLVARLRHAEAASRQRERRTAALLAFTADSARAVDVAEVASAVAAHAEDVLAAPVVVLVPGGDGALAAAAGLAPLAAQELAVVRAAHEQRRPAGRGTQLVPSARLLALPLLAGGDSAGVVAVHLDRARRRIDREARELLEAIARQAGLAIARLRLTAEARDAELRVQAEELRSALLSTVSHDLRTPLAVITGTATALREISSALTPDQLAAIDTIVEEATWLGRILTNLLAITRVEHGGEIHSEWVPVEEIVGSALARAEAVLAGRDVALDLAPDIGVRVNPILIEQLLLNLLENAAKHTPPATPIEIAAALAGDGVAIEVADRGPGVPPGAEHQVFQKLYRGPNARGAGAGLGLAVCRGIATAHGGTIEAAQRSGGGATFRIWLPGGAPPPPPIDDRAIDDHAIDDHAIDDRAVDDRAVDDRAVDDRAVDDRAVDDRAIDDRAVDDRAIEPAPTGPGVSPAAGAAP
jgi:two-component system sensor histidine kinase KdpD